MRLHQAAAVGDSDLAVSILGPWVRAPRAARDAYERFVAAVSSLLGGEASSEEVHEAGRVVWSTLTDAPSRERTQGRGSAAAVKQIGSVPLSHHRSIVGGCEVHLCATAAQRALLVHRHLLQLNAPCRLF